MELGPNINLIPRIRGANSYAVLDESQVAGRSHATLIDTGMPGNARTIIEFLESIGKSQADSVTIILTHSDIDHAGSVSELKEKLENTKVAIHEADAQRLAGEKPLKEVRGFARLVLKAASPFMKLKPVTADILLRGGEQVDGLTVVHTPGHTRGSICLYSERLQAMFVGDALATDRDRTPSLPRASMSADIDEAKNSARKIASYEFQLLLPGHGPPILSDASRKVKELVANLG
jgi:glyoxylase-like metal-dependent hydrolase (beta-lactamase superfamily II)